MNYGYDSIYRLTRETIAGDPNAVNGTVSYVYDAVGNRTQKVSTLPGYPGGLSNYNANDELATDTYDAAGNTTQSQGLGYVYDFENHLVQAGAGINYVYDGDGNRVQKTAAGVVTRYQVATLNPTGYAQVIGEELPNGYPVVTYVYGLEQISRTDQLASVTSYYVHDGHGSVRALTDVNGNVTDTYDYDAFGNLIHSTGTSANNYLFAGEQFDLDLGLYYNRARYLSTSTGRFWSMDSLDGEDDTPISLHRYLYGNTDPINNLDPSGNEDISEAIGSLGVSNSINATSVLHYNPSEHQYRTASTISFRGYEFIKLQEGLKKIPYGDHGGNKGNCTIGYGHLIHLGGCIAEDFAQYPNGISPDLAEQFLFLDAFKIAILPMKFLVSVPLAQKEFDALADFTYNIGAGDDLTSLAVGKGLASTTLLRILNLGFYGSVPAEFRRFTKSGGVALPGLARRRDEESLLWTTGVYVSNGQLIP
jgi:RHS repeat-associated protein